MELDISMLSKISHMWNLGRGWGGWWKWHEYKKETVGERGNGIEGMAEGESEWRVNMVEVHMCVYENRIIKSIKILLKGDRRIRKSNRMNTIKVPCMHVWKFHNETPWCN
jgi:hypothetical protein